jgi:hypothetical protein
LARRIPSRYRCAAEYEIAGAAAQSLSSRPAKPRYTSTGSHRGADTLLSPPAWDDGSGPHPAQLTVPRRPHVPLRHGDPPAQGLPGLARSHRRAVPRRLTPLAGLGLGAYLAPGEQYVLTTAGPCDCDTAVGHQVRASRQAERPHDDAARRLAAKGWSSARIARSLALLESGVAYVGLVLHDYEGPVDAGVALTGRQIVALGRETAPLRTVLAPMRDDGRYDVRGHRDRTVAASASSLAP